MNIDNINGIQETIRLTKHGISIKVVRLIGKEGGFFVVLAPSINVSGYGRTKEEALKGFQENIELFCSDLMALSKEDRNKELVNLGFRRTKFFNKNYSKSYVDENGALQNFDEGTVEKNIVEEILCA